MQRKIKYLGLIPARGGSKRVLKKNVRSVNGKPLIYWSIKSAKESKLLDTVVVSTEDIEVKKIAEEYDVEVIERPKEYSTDNVSLTTVLKHALKTIPAENIVVLRPTSPIRIDSIIDQSIKKFEKENGDSLMTGFMNKEYEWFTHPDQASQELEGWFQGDGCVEIHKSDVILSGESFGFNAIRYIVDEKYNYEIDTEYQLVMVEQLMKYLGIGGKK